MIARTVIVESRLGGQFWFKAAEAGKDACNAVYKTRTKTSPHQAVYGEPFVSWFSSCWCKAYVLNRDSKEMGKHTARAIKAINLGFASNTSHTFSTFRKRRQCSLLIKYSVTKWVPFSEKEDDQTIFIGQFSWCSVSISFLCQMGSLQQVSCRKLC